MRPKSSRRTNISSTWTKSNSNHSSTKPNSSSWSICSSNYNRNNRCINNSNLWRRDKCKIITCARSQRKRGCWTRAEASRKWSWRGRRRRRRVICKMCWGACRYRKATKISFRTIYSNSISRCRHITSLSARWIRCRSKSSSNCNR